MLRISKLTDYAVALTTHLARCQVGPYAPGSPGAPRDLQGLAGATAQQQPDVPNVPNVPNVIDDEAGPEAGNEAGNEAGHDAGHESVRALAAATGVPEPTARKVLKTLAHAGIVASVRGTHGGYALTRPAADITVADVVIAVEGPIAVTECASEATAGACDLEGRCNVQGPWQRISAAIRDALEELTLADMAAPAAADAPVDRAGAHDPSLIPLRIAGVPQRPAGQSGRSQSPASPSNLGSNP
ncbi:MAG TPA: Rrf2 family transcriptional regulator [Haliangium sp.]|nr:Rrf2 family transcriptional regulator [Haliangium sp.]